MLQEACRISLGSVLVSLLWNVVWNKVFVLPVPEETTTVGFVDDLVVTVTAKYPEDVEVYTMET